MSSRTRSWNGFETALNGAVDAVSGVMTLLSVDNLPTDVFLVIDPDTPAIRDYVYVVAIDSGLKQITVRTPRPEEGATGGTGHPHADGAIVRAVPVHQWMDLVFGDIESLEAFDANHAPGVDPHPQYLTPAEGDVAYVKLSGSTMDAAAQIKVDTDPVVDDDLSRKNYVDSTISNDIATHAADVAAHHAKYTDAEALAAVKANDTSKTVAAVNYNVLTTDQVIILDYSAGGGGGQVNINLPDPALNPFQGVIITMGKHAADFAYITAGAGGAVLIFNGTITGINLGDAGLSAAFVNDGSDWFVTSQNGVVIP